MYLISQLFISSRNTGLVLCKNFVYVRSIVMIHKYGTPYPYFTKLVPTYAMKCHDKLDRVIK